MRDFIDVVTHLGQPLLEGRDAYLFHGTSIAYAARILMEDQLGKGGPTTVSLSRSYAKAEAIAGHGHEDTAVFVMDQRSLSQRYRIAPFHDHAWATSGWYENGSEMNDEQEEVVKGVIHPLQPHLISINVPERKIRQYLASEKLPWPFRDAMGSDELAKKALTLLQSSPKLNRWFEPGARQVRARVEKLRAGSIVYTKTGWLFIDAIEGDEARIRHWYPFRDKWLKLETVWLDQLVPIRAPQGEDAPSPP